MQIKTFKPQVVALRDESRIDELKEALADLDHKPEIIPGEQGVIEVENIFFVSYNIWLAYLMKKIFFFFF